MVSKIVVLLHHQVWIHFIFFSIQSIKCIDQIKCIYKMLMAWNILLSLHRIEQMLKYVLKYCKRFHVENIFSLKIVQSAPDDARTPAWPLASPLHCPLMLYNVCVDRNQHISPGCADLKTHTVSDIHTDLGYKLQHHWNRNEQQTINEIHTAP